MISLFFILFCSTSLHSSSAYQCPGPNNFATIPQEPLCPGNLLPPIQTKALHGANLPNSSSLVHVI
jgi:hypothetical protein